MTGQKKAGRKAQTEEAAGEPIATGGPMTKVMTKARRRKAVAPAPPMPTKKPRPKTRENKKGLVLYVQPEVTVALRRLALDTDKSVQILGMEALNMLFEKHGVATFHEDRE